MYVHARKGGACVRVREFLSLCYVEAAGIRDLCHAWHEPVPHVAFACATRGTNSCDAWLGELLFPLNCSEIPNYCLIASEPYTAASTPDRPCALCPLCAARMACSGTARTS